MLLYPSQFFSCLKVTFSPDLLYFHISSKAVCLYCNREEQLICTARVMEKSILPAVTEQNSWAQSTNSFPLLWPSSIAKCQPFAQPRNIASLPQRILTALLLHLGGQRSPPFFQAIFPCEGASGLIPSGMLRYSQDWQASRKSQISDKVHFSKHCLEHSKRCSRRTLNLYLFI